MKELIGKCGFYCGACPTYLAGNCLGCVEEHKEGDCYTRDCVIKSGIRFCGECKSFPCDTILTQPHTTVLDKDWLRWKKNSNTNRQNECTGEQSIITLDVITEENWLDVANLSVKEEQKGYVALPIGILARAYVYRDCNAQVFVIRKDETIIGVAMIRELHDEPVGYDLQQFMIDKHFQKQGYGTEALQKILAELKMQEKYKTVEVCVKMTDAEAIRLYKKVGFVDSGYVDETVPDSYNLVYRF